MKKILILINIVIACIICGCNQNSLKEYDSIILTKGTFKWVEKCQDNFPDSLYDNGSDFYPIFSPKSIVKISDKNIAFYLDEYKNENKGYFKATLSKKQYLEFERLFTKVDFNNFLDSSFVHKNHQMIYDGFNYFLFIISESKVKRIDFIDAIIYKNDFLRFVTFIDSLDDKIILSRLNDSLSIKSDFDTLKISIVKSLKDKMPIVKKDVEIFE